MERLSLAHPGYLWGALAVGLPILIHLFNRRQPRPLPFGAIEFVLRSHRQKKRQLRLRQLLLLLARCLLLLSIALALSRPSLLPQGGAASSASGPQATALVLDASLSMRYRLEGKTLFATARAEALAALDRLGPDEPALVGICAGPEGLLSPAGAPSFDRAAARRALEAAEAGWLSSDLTTCLSQAARALSASQLPGKKLFAFTDLAAHSIRLDAPPPLVPPAPGAADQTPIKPTVVLVDAAASLLSSLSAEARDLPNAAILSVQAQPAPRLGPRGYEVAATVANFGKRPLESLPVSLRIGDKQVAKGFVDLPPGASVKKTLGAVLPAGLALGKVELARQPAGLDEDDAREFAVPVPRDLRVLAVDGAPASIRSRDEAWFVETALAAARTAGRVQLTTVDVGGAETRPFEELDVILLLNVAAPKRQLAEKLRAFVQKGGGLFIALGDHAEPDADNEALAGLLPRPLHLIKTAGGGTGESGLEEAANAPAARFGLVDWQHPIFRVFGAEGREGLASARTFRYALLKAEGRPEARTLASFDDGAPALVEAPLGAGRVLLLTTSVSATWTDWPIRPSFLPVLQQIVSHLAGALEEKAAAAALAGEERSLEPPPGQRITAVLGPDGKPLPLRAARAASAAAAAASAAVTVPAPGVYRVQVAQGGQAPRDEPSLAFAAGPDPRESDLRRVDEAELRSALGGSGSALVAGSASEAQGPRGTPLWAPLLLLAVLALLGEGLLTRK
jgi:Aerotolerance regulator N-terminal